MSKTRGPEINTIYDARLNGLLIGMAAMTSDFEVAKQYMQIAGLQLNEEQWKTASELYGYSQTELAITAKASEMVAQRASVNEGREPVRKAWKVNDIGQKLAEGPALTILDGGPGAGKSFSLGKSMDAMQVPVICLGATESAAAGLYNDMTDAQQDHVKDAEAGKDVPPRVPVLGGLTVDDILSTKELSKERQKDKNGNEIEGSSPFEKKEALLKALNGNPKPCIMVDETGLLGHDQIDGILKFAQENGAKMILAGDSQQIPPEKGQPFKMLTESLKDTPAYVNAPYVFRQGDFIEKAITSGIYHGNDSSQIGISEKMATEFMIAAYDVGDPKAKGKDGDFTLETRLSEKYPELGKNEAVAKYVSEMAEKAKSMTPEKLKETVNNGLSAGKDGEVDRDAYDTYVCAALACQAMGIRAYEQKDQVKDVSGDVYADVAKDFAADYVKSLENGYNARKKKAEKKGKDTSKLKFEYPDGKLAITATEKEADELNKAIRKAMNKEGGLQAGEPIILEDGSRVLATEEQAKNPPQGFKYAYALDVKTTQGMSQVGKVTFVVRGDTMDKMHGGEILVGATRHKGEFEIKMDEGASKNKEGFYNASTQQYASARIVNEAFQPKLYKAAKSFEGKVDSVALKAEVSAKRNSSANEHRSVMRSLMASEKKQESTQSKLMKISQTKEQMNNAVNKARMGKKAQRNG